MEFRPAHYARLLAERLSLTQMDELLANGYYRNGLDICANSVRMMKMDWVSAVMLRVRLADFVWKKRLRKLLRSNDLKFQIECRPFLPTLEMEALWQRYKNDVHGWRNVPTLAKHILRGQTADDFNTWQLCVYSGGKLVAFSLFDRGLRSIASLEAAYNPDFSQHSLGIYTMLLEIAWCQAHGLEFYYPGFFPKNDPMFDYKLRPGNVEYFQVESAKWQPIEALSSSDWKLDELSLRHSALQSLLQTAGFYAAPGFSHCLYQPTDQPALSGSNLQTIVPLLIGTDKYAMLFLHWDLEQSTYHVFEGRNSSPQMDLASVQQLKAQHFFKIETGNYFGTAKTPTEVLLLVQEIKQWVTSHA